MNFFKLFLKQEEASEDHLRVALYDPINSTLVWENDGSTLFSFASSGEPVNDIFPISPESPGRKIKALRKIKIQLGFACNYSCSYCSQNNLRNSADHSAAASFKKIDSFFSSIEKWFDGGEDGLGQGVSLEFWGGETLIYWDSIERLTELLKKRYPHISLALFTNGSLVKESMVDFAMKMGLHFVVSHDGETFNNDRARDPFEIPSQAKGLHYLFKNLNPKGLVSFNATLTPKNFSLLKIRDYIAGKLGVSPSEISLSYDLATAYDKAGLNYVVRPHEESDLVNKIFAECLKLYPSNLRLGQVDKMVLDFIETLQRNLPIKVTGQKCSMDLPSSLAVDLDGNILTCQNVTAKGGHLIGHVERLNDARLDTAYHFSKRSECLKCPVVQICRGSCMFLTGPLWKSACQQHFTWALAYMAFSLYLQTGMKLLRIEGSDIRGSGHQGLDVLRA